jgi:ATP-binding cassette subfamily F protein uup
MSLIALRDVRYGIGGPDLLLEDVQWSLEPGERVCVVGRNGAGKSTLMKLLAGEVQPDEGAIVLASGLRVARLAQEVPHGTRGSVFDVVASGLGTLGADLAEFHRLSHALHDAQNLAEIAVVQARIEGAQGWDMDRRVTEVVQRLSLAEGDGVRGAVGRHEAAGAAGARAGVAARSAAAGRAHQPPRPRFAIAWLEDFLQWPAWQRWCSSPMTAASCARSPPASWRSTAAR